MPHPVAPGAASYGSESGDAGYLLARGFFLAGEALF